MKTLLIAAIVGVFLFAGSAAVSWYLMNQQEIAKQDEEPSEEEVTPEDIIAPVTDKIEKVDKMPVGLRASVPLTLQSVQEMSRSVKAKEQELKIREDRLDQEEVGLSMLREDLGKERRELEAFATRIESKIRKLEELVQDAKIQNEMLDKKKAEIEIATTPANGGEDDGNLDAKAKGILKTLGDMPDNVISRYLSSMAAEGEISLAAKLLQKLESDKRNKVVESMEEELVHQLLDLQ